MTIVTSYATLVDAILEEMDDTTLDDFVPGFIQRAEAMFNRRLYGLDTDSTSTVPTVAGTATVALPTGYKGMISIRIDDYAPLTQLSPDDFQAKWHEATDAVPQNWAIIDGAITLGPAPDAVYTVTINAFRTLTALSESDMTNWLIEQHPDLYLDATLAYGYRHIQDEPRHVEMLASAEKIIAEINAYDARKRRSNLVETVPAEYF